MERFWDLVGASLTSFKILPFFFLFFSFFLLLHLYVSGICGVFANKFCRVFPFARTMSLKMEKTNVAQLKPSMWEILTTHLYYRASFSSSLWQSRTRGGIAMGSTMADAQALVRALRSAYASTPIKLKVQHRQLFFLSGFFVPQSHAFELHLSFWFPLWKDRCFSSRNRVFGTRSVGPLSCLRAWIQ